MKSNKEKFKKGQKVKIIEALYGNHKEDRIGKIKSFNNAGEIWVDFPDGSGGLVKKVKAVLRGRKPLNPETIILLCCQFVFHFLATLLF